MKNFLTNIKWFAAGFLLVGLIASAVYAVPAIGQGTNPNDRDSTGSTGVFAEENDLSNLTTDSDSLAPSELKTENGQALGIAPAEAGTTNHADVPEGLTDGGVEGGIELDTNVQVFGPADFNADGYTPDDFFLSFWYGQLIGSTASPCFNAPVSAPLGSTISEFWATVFDNNASTYLWLNLYRVNNYTGVGETMAAISSLDSASLQQISDLTVVQPVVDYPNYSYYIGTCIGGADLYLKSVRVWWNP